MLIMRVPGRISSGRCKRVLAENGYIALVLSRAPPPGSRQAPMIAGKQVTVRTAMPPPPCRCSP
jgi:hypothetical protein